MQFYKNLGGTPASFKTASERALAGVAVLFPQLRPQGLLGGLITRAIDECLAVVSPVLERAATLFSFDLKTAKSRNNFFDFKRMSDALRLGKELSCWVPDESLSPKAWC